MSVRVLSGGFVQQCPYLCLWSWMNLRQNCVLPEPPRPYRMNLFCIVQSFSGLPEKMFFSSLSAISRLPVKMLLALYGTQKYLFRRGRSCFSYMIGLFWLGSYVSSISEASLRRNLSSALKACSHLVAIKSLQSRVYLFNVARTTGKPG